MKFSTLPLSSAMVHNLGELGYQTMTPIQAQSLPHVLEGRDVLAQAKTGSGKTAAFGIGLLSKLQVDNYRVQALVLCPTRELADQVAKEFRRLARSTPNVKVLTLSGGVPFGPQLGSLKHEAHIIVGTPGRVLKHLKRGSLFLGSLETLVLDEADRMLDMGFIDEIRHVMRYVPRQRQTLLFSATYPEQILHLSASIQQDAIDIQLESEEVANKITEYFYGMGPKEKMGNLVKVIAKHKPNNVIVFSNTKVQCQDIAQSLFKQGIDALAIHGDLEQYQRTDVLVQFANRSCSVLVATDVAARGLDIKELSMVVNFDLPQDETVYTHRIGRTARAGHEGLAVTFFTRKDEYRIVDYHNDTRLFEESDELEEAGDYALVPPNITLVVEGGKKNKVRPGDLLGALTGDAGIDGKCVGKIDVNDRQSYVAIERSVAKSALERLKAGKIKGKKFPVWILN